MQNAKRIGIFAGTFDPVHDGHLAFAQAALEHGVEKVMFLPEPRPRRKQGVRALEHRVAMVKLAIAHEPKMGAILLEHARFTVHETLPKLQARFPDHRLVLLFGGDVIAHIASWPDVDSLLTSVDLLIATRHSEVPALTATLKTLHKTRGLKLHYKIIQPAYDMVASSPIRLALKRGKEPVGLNPKVQAYIKKHQLYAAA